ncbi:hypothetical protein [Bradyrhizobium sp. CCBAU 51753]|uniref:hypothetical protein n=1 Tax=Bradyrhizobium sp. CCBAU 51753 TaxID=1325100 RepID=UPI00188B0285|nr:hypothetical protein [Bradyrhizobium sp. CCBAU 51753]QOZ26302.1 hypothetical protein XH93_23890 [Bradyrhizobium sp. CCBAU 51753]
MHLRRLANLWILLFVAAGLLLAPVAPAFARMAPDAAMGAMPAMSDDMQAMSDDMPCCPDQSKNKACDDCPFVALCMLSVPLSVPAGVASLIERHPLKSRFAAHDDHRRDGLGAKPPDHPPRTEV